MRQVIHQMQETRQTRLHLLLKQGNATPQLLPFHRLGTASFLCHNRPGFGWWAAAWIVSFRTRNCAALWICRRPTTSGPFPGSSISNKSRIATEAVDVDKTHPWHLQTGRLTVGVWIDRYGPKQLSVCTVRTQQTLEANESFPQVAVAFHPLPLLSQPPTSLPISSVAMFNCIHMPILRSNCIRRQGVKE